jgi:hypothetical protein
MWVRTSLNVMGLTRPMDLEMKMEMRFFQFHVASEIVATINNFMMLRKCRSKRQKLVMAPWMQMTSSRPYGLSHQRQEGDAFVWLYRRYHEDALENWVQGFIIFCNQHCSILTVNRLLCCHPMYQIPLDWQWIHLFPLLLSFVIWIILNPFTSP